MSRLEDRMRLSRRPRGRVSSAAFVLFLSSWGGAGFALSRHSQSDVSGTWDARFSGTVRGAGTSQTDDFVIEIRQNGATVSGTLRVRGLDSAFALSGKVSGTTFGYTVRGRISPTCEVVIEAETTVDAAAGRLRGRQTQSTCEGTAVGEVTAVRREARGGGG